MTWLAYFDEIKNRLGKRKGGFSKIFSYLDEIKYPVILETGTYREENNYEGDGCSTLLYDNYIKYNGGKLISVDIDPKACELAKENTVFAKVYCEDSVEFLGQVEGEIDFLYLDSFNIQNWNNDWEASSHHLKELFAAKNCIKEGTLIVVDDNLNQAGRKLKIGKGRLISELMASLGIKPYIDDYQMGWIWEELE
tara:strand:- start:1295 stop:1879 length:585 start_codon:yes stop_codon:yes gene_type:complete